jgi:hypothetical protein
MDKKYPLVGEAFFRTMMCGEDERRRLFVRGDLWSNHDASNIVSLERYRREQQSVHRSADKPTKPAA